MRYELNCIRCKEPVTKSNKTKVPVCFSCKLKRRKQYAK